MMRGQRNNKLQNTKMSYKEDAPTQNSINPDQSTDSIKDIKANFHSLPLRPKGNYNNKLAKTKLLTNLYKVQFNPNLTINIYSVKIEPGIQHDSTKKLNAIINSARKDLKPYLGASFVTCGRTIYSCETPKSQKELITVPARFGTQNYELILKHVKKVKMSNITSENTRESLLPLNFMNNLIKQFFNEMNYVEVGKSGKYINPNSKFAIPNAGVILFSGYEASISMLQGGLYLRVDGLTKIVQDKTALQFINSLYIENSHLNKQQKRMIVQENMIGKVVVANYGNSRHWRVSDVIFDIDFDQQNIAEETNLTYTEYYKKNYGLNIKNKKQPVLIAVVNGKKKRQAILIPEFVLLSGLPDNFDERKRREISERTILAPDAKLEKIQSLISSFNSDNENFSTSALSQSIGVSFAKETETVDAISLNPPHLQLGSNNSIQQNKVSFFNLYNKPLYGSDVPLKILAFIPNDYDFSGITKIFDSTCRNLRLKHNIIPIKIQYQDQKRALEEIRALLQDKPGRFSDRNFCWFLLPGNLKTMYPTLKKLCLSVPNPKLSQITLSSTLAKKGFASIITKILIQISSKLGNIPWAPKISKTMSKGVMLMAIDICPDGKNKKQMIISYCSTINEECTKFHANYRVQRAGIKYNEKIKEITAECLAAYGKYNNAFPTELIFLKFGCSDSEKGTLIQNQISEIKSVIKDLKDFDVKLSYIIVDLAAKQKFFMQKQNIVNPVFGTLINSKVVGNNYDFYMIAQHCNKGTVKPVHYEVLYNESHLQEGVLQEFIYGQCFNYMNWSGSVRVPGVMQYARKLSRLISEHLHESLSFEKLSDHLFFI